MTDQPITFQVVAESLLKDMLENIVRQHTLVNIANRISIQKTVGSANGSSFSNTLVGSNRDIFGQDKQKLKSTETARYFQCENCSRKIAGARFAQHISKCLERRKR
ncbi:SAGA-associated factor 11 [Suhomyces tanzawaensis NRRL Y-17324]|uniref:SAGA-associated factor 11 n=1 Tax=Suhomyces tanzawaensis NRRL Y-17324 TaxID=984487 RepID=A0A1E4SI82_9ASCO|nr:SAGA-associated factor 11 [Suhomyces tanzawaensis NRRL Y-17324]ODV79224.1 SAGA-associated factor 11 [Suhomyces tanzawaensis NRRL Y-17324]